MTDGDQAVSRQQNVLEDGAALNVRLRIM